jgi:hypothetical protein
MQAINLAFNGNNQNQQRPGTQGGISSLSPNIHGRGNLMGNDVAMRVKKYK